jgi:hypothetical protein
MKKSQDLTRCRRKIEGFSDAREDVALGDATGVTLVNGGSEGGEFGLDRPPPTAHNPPPLRR